MERERRKRLLAACLLWAVLGPLGAALLLAALAWCLADGFLIPRMARTPPPGIGGDSPRKGRF